MTKGGSLLVLGEELRRRLLLNLLPRPLLILQVQSDLALVHCPSINGNNPEGETDKQTNNTCASNKGKQTNKQTSRGGTCGGADAGGSVELHSMWSLIHNASEYMEELQSVTLSSPGHRQGPLGLTGIRSANRMPPLTTGQ